MRRTALLGAAALVVAVNGFVLGHVAWNRAGTPDATMVLTERELPVAYSPREVESSAISLCLDADHMASWGRLDDPDLDVLKWLDGAKLGELGFDVHIPSNFDEATEHLSRQLARKAYVVLEFQGPAWESYRAALERLRSPRTDAQSAPAVESWQAEAAARDLRSGSRLFIVDAGLDPVALRKRHADRGAYLVLPAKIRAYLDARRTGVECQSESCRARGIVSLAIDEVVVPRRLHSALPPSARTDQTGSRASADHDPTYEVAIRSGALYEPWVESIQSLSGATQ